MFCGCLFIIGINGAEKAFFYFISLLPEQCLYYSAAAARKFPIKDEEQNIIITTQHK